MVAVAKINSPAPDAFDGTQSIIINFQALSLNRFLNCLHATEVPNSQATQLNLFEMNLEGSGL